MNLSSQANETQTPPLPPNKISCNAKSSKHCSNQSLTHSYRELIRSFQNLLNPESTDGGTTGECIFDLVMACSKAFFNPKPSIWGTIRERSQARQKRTNGIGTKAKVRRPGTARHPITAQSGIQIWWCDRRTYIRFLGRLLESLVQSEIHHWWCNRRTHLNTLGTLLELGFCTGFTPSWYTRAPPRITVRRIHMALPLSFWGRDAAPRRSNLKRL